MKYERIVKLAEYYYKLAKEEPIMFVSNDGNKYWRLNGRLHREDGPAIEYTDGEKKWYHHGKLHRVNGPAVERNNGDNEWFINGLRHREDGPAVEYANGKKEWWANDLLHREDGPAVESANGEKQYWYYDILKPKERMESVPLIVSYDPQTKTSTYKNISVCIDWTDTPCPGQDIWTFDLDTLQLGHIPTLIEIAHKIFPCARLEDIESGNI